MENEQIITEYRSGKTAQQIALSNKIPYTTIYLVLKEANVLRERGGIDYENNTKLCSQCRKILSLEEFDKAKNTQSGYRSNCRECRAERAKETRIDYNKRTPEEKAIILEKNRSIKLRHPERLLHRYAKLRAKKNGIPFDIEVSDVIIPTHCPILGIPLAFNRGSLGSGSPTLDKITPVLGYTKGNVQVLSWKANKLKSNGTVEELELIVKYLKELQCQNMSIKRNSLMISEAS